jgi:hypothetical protein
MSAAFPSRAETDRVKAAIAAALDAHNVTLTLGSDWNAGRAAVYSNMFVYGDYCYTCAVQMLRGPAFALVFYESVFIYDFQRFQIKNADEVADVIDAYLESITR